MCDFSEDKWRLFKEKEKEMLIYGLSNELIDLYDPKLIEKLRGIYYGGLPASIILLCDGLTNGHCYDRAYLLARAFIDTNDDVRLVYASIDSLRLNPHINRDFELADEHCFLERTTSDGRELVYDTSTGFVYDKDYYYKIENPSVRLVRNKDEIKEMIKMDNISESPDDRKFTSVMILPFLEKVFDNSNEMYSKLNLLQEEIRIFKEKINYDSLKKEVYDEIRKLG